MENLEIKQIKDAIDFSNFLERENKGNFRDLLKLLADYKTIYNKEKKKLPFHINVIDDLHADENAHSRIFAKLLRYKENNKYPFLEKFLNDVCNFNVSIEKPIVKKVDSCGRIDIPIFDKKYVVIIENKVTDKASDQNKEGGQLARYIETIKNSYGRNLEDIYVVYTPKYAREPSDECWKKDDVFYKDDFKDRFRSLSYRDEIYPWLKNKILPVIDEKNIYLRSAVEQYIDHLEGEEMFSLRTINKEMNMKLQEFIKKELGLQDDKPEEAIEILFEKETELNNAISQIQQLKSKYQKQNVMNYFENWEKSLQIDFPTLKVVGDKFKLKKGTINVGVIFSLENQNFVAIIECNDCNKPNIYFGVGRHFVSEIKHQTSEILQKILNDNKLKEPEDFWYGWKHTSLERAYMRLKTLIESIENLKKEQG